MEVTIKGRTITLQAPPSHVARQKALLAVAQDAWIGLGAALGVCWASTPKLKASFAASKYDGIVYGAAVRDELHALGASDEEVGAACNQALQLIVDSYPRESAVAEHADFIAPQTEASTPSP